MKILVVSQYFYPEEFKINDICRELVNRGHTVDVVTGLPNYPYGTIFKGYEKKFFEKYYGVNIFRTKTRPRGKNSIQLFLNYISFLFKARKKIKKLKGPYDVIYVYQLSPVFQIAPAIYAKRKFKCKIVTYCCDQWPISLNARGMSKGIFYKIISKYCRRIYNKVDFLINSSPSFIEYNHNTNKVPYEKMCFLIQHAACKYNCSDLKKELNGNIDLLFAGNIGKVQNVEDIILAYNELKYENLYIHIVGDGSNFIECKKLVENLKLEKNIMFYGKVSINDMSKFYKKVDACILTLSGNTPIGNTIPSKLIGYMEAGKTVIAAISGDSCKIIDEAKCGIYTIPDNYLKLADLFKYYHQNFQEFYKYGDSGRQYFEEKCLLNIHVDQLTEILKKNAKEKL